jgi:hypothetical protein
MAIRPVNAVCPPATNVFDNASCTECTNPLRRYKEKRPFESWEQLEAVAERLGPVYGERVSPSAFLAPVLKVLLRLGSSHSFGLDRDRGWNSSRA